MTPLRACACLLVLATASAAEAEFTLGVKPDDQAAILARTKHGCDGGNVGEACPNTSSPCLRSRDVTSVDETYGTSEATCDATTKYCPTCKKATCRLGLRPAKLWDADLKDEAAEKLELGFFCSEAHAAKQQTCFDKVPAGAPITCKQMMDNPAISLAGYNCETSAQAIVDEMMSFPGGVGDEVKKALEGNEEAAGSMLEGKRFLDFCAATCTAAFMGKPKGACEMDTAAKVEVNIPGVTDEQVANMMNDLHGSICVAYGYQKKGPTASATVLDVMADFAACGIKKGETTISAGRRLGVAALNLQAPLPAMDELEADLKDNEESVIAKSGKAMGSPILGNPDATVEADVERPSNEGEGIGIKGLIAIAVAIILCVVCCPLCCCIYCCCCKKKKDGAN